MNISRRLLLQLATVTTVAPATASLASEEDFPSRPITLIFGFPPGGVANLYARVIFDSVSKRLGEPVVIESKAGAASNLAAEMVVRAPADGYTLLFLTSANSWNAALYDNLKFDLLSDIVPVASLTRGIGVLVTNPAFPATTIPEFIAYLRANPGKVTMASGGVGSPQHLYGELFTSMVGVNMLHVPYRGGGPALADLLGGHVQVMFDTLPTSIQLVEAGKLRALGVTSARRSDVLPNVPAIGEFVSGYQADGWQGIGVPRNTPSEVINKLHQVINASLAEPDVKSRIVAGGYSIFISPTPADFGKFVVDFTAKWARVIRNAGIKAD